MTKLTRLDCGLLHADLAMFEAGSEGDVTLPVNAWLVQHARGTVLFDAGLPATFVEGSATKDRVLKFMGITVLEEDTVAAQLSAVSQDPAKVDFVVISHLHFDHMGGLSQIPNATLIIQREEWEAGMAVSQETKTLHERSDFDLGHKLRLIDGEYDLFGDDTVVCIPTPGHTVGHQSLRVTLATGHKVLLASDCCYFSRTIDSQVLPTFGYDLEEQSRTLQRVRKLRDEGAMVIPGHDINFVNNMPKILGIDN